LYAVISFDGQEIHADAIAAHDEKSKGKFAVLLNHGIKGEEVQRLRYADVPVFPACGFSPCSMALL
jgi:hypothetical protein